MIIEEEKVLIYLISNLIICIISLIMKIHFKRR